MCRRDSITVLYVLPKSISSDIVASLYQGFPESSHFAALVRRGGGGIELLVHEPSHG